MDSELLALPVVELAALIRRRAVSPVEVMTASLERIERVDPLLNSIVTLDADGALAAARAAEARTGTADAPPFDGVPLAVKDLHLTRGMRTTFGTVSLASFVPGTDDEHVARLRRAGFVVVGKTNVPELGTLPVSESVLLGPCRNPWDPSRTPGGSSGGAAAALAAQLVPAVQGSDGAGSIRIPASNCGVFGFKPSRGRVSSAPLGDLLPGLSTAGPLSRHVVDAAALLDVMRGYALGDPSWAPPPARDYVRDAAQDPPRLRVGLVTTSPLGTFSPETVTAAEDAARLLERLGHAVEPFALPVGERFKDDFQTVWAAGLATAPVPPATLEPFNEQLAALGRRTSAPALLQATASLQQQARAIVTASDSFDVVVAPTLMREPLAVGELAPLAADAAGLLDVLAGYVGFTPVANVTGQPSMSLPLGRSATGLPLGVMVTGRPADEATLFALAGQVQRAADWTAHRPALAEAR